MIPRSTTVSQRSLLFLVLALTGVLGCSQASQIPPPSGPRFRDTNDILSVSDSQVNIPIRGLGYLEYPRHSSAAWAEADVPVVFVIDTMGRIERETITFLEPVPAREFRSSVCEGLRRAGFGHPVFEGRRRRVLVAQLHSFRPDRVHSALPRQIGEFWTRYRGLPRTDLFERLESLPHC